jgi:predicted DNA-binding protein (MmcQ/YjbR family)
MNIETLRTYCISRKGATESLPFGDDTLVFKVKGRIFALMNLDGETNLNLKCDPEKAIALREKYSCVIPGYHMNKKHWNTIIIDGSVPETLVHEWIDESYRLVEKSAR